MESIEKIDRNLAVKGLPDDRGFVFKNVLEEPFRVYGLLRPEQEGRGFRRVPKAVAEKTNEGVLALSVHTAGGRVRFQTNARKVAIRARLRSVGLMPHFAVTGSAGFDLYVENCFAGAFVPPYSLMQGETVFYESVLSFDEALAPGSRFREDKLREVMIHFPLYSGVISLEVGLPENSLLGETRGYRDPLPIVYYGSSITQGGCASRPGNSYQAHLSRWLDIDHLNLGFSGSARGEAVMAEYIATLPMKAFVLDYDHNAPSAAHLAATHEPFYRCIRKAHPEVPILMLTRPQPFLKEEEEARRRIVLETYEKAKSAGDGKVYFVDGTRLFSDGGETVVEDATVDGAHPTDLGFYLMAKNLCIMIQKALKE